MYTILTLTLTLWDRFVGSGYVCCVVQWMIPALIVIISKMSYSHGALSTGQANVLKQFSRTITWMVYCQSNSLVPVNQFCLQYRMWFSAFCVPYYFVSCSCGFRCVISDVVIGVPSNRAVNLELKLWEERCKYLVAELIVRVRTACVAAKLLC